MKEGLIVAGALTSYWLFCRLYMFVFVEKMLGHREEVEETCKETMQKERERIQRGSTV